MSDLTPYLTKLLAKQVFTQGEASSAMRSVLDNAAVEQIAAFFILLKYRGETADEIVGLLTAIEACCTRIQLPYPVLDIVGTGGDRVGTVNISTGSAILAAACGISIVKHGNRAVSSLCGSADVLEQLEIQIVMTAEQVQACLQAINIAFIYAPEFNPVIKKLRALRKAIGVPTVLNQLGPLLNPARAEYALIGVAQAEALDLMSAVILRQNRIKHALVFHGCGLDELTTLGTMTAYEIQNGERRLIEIDPSQLGFKRCTLSDLQGGDAEKNARLLVDALSGADSPFADALILNAGAALMIFGRVTTLAEGVASAREVLVSGKATVVLNQWQALSKRLAGECYAT